MEMNMTLRTNLILRDGRLGFSSVLLLLLMATACGRGNVRATASPPAPEVRVAPVIQQDVPVCSEWVATLDGYVNAEIRPQVSGHRNLVEAGSNEVFNLNFTDRTRRRYAGY
jgi:membrane fusion protein (multidrug efflux system)